MDRGNSPGNRGQPGRPRHPESATEGPHSSGVGWESWRQCEPERTWVVVHDAPKLATGGANPQVFVESIEDTVAFSRCRFAT